MILRNFIESDAEQTFKSFAAKVGVTERAVHSWTAGTRTPNRRQMLRIFQVTNGQVQPNDFFDLSDQNTAA